MAIGWKLWAPEPWKEAEFYRARAFFGLSTWIRPSKWPLMVKGHEQKLLAIYPLTLTQIFNTLRPFLWSGEGKKCQKSSRESLFWQKTRIMSLNMASNQEKLLIKVVRHVKIEYMTHLLIIWWRYKAKISKKGPKIELCRPILGKKLYKMA